MWSVYNGAETPVTIEPPFDPDVDEYNARVGTTAQSVKIKATPDDSRAEILFNAGKGTTDIDINPSCISGDTLQIGTHNGGSTAGATGINLPFYVTLQATADGESGQLYKINIVTA